MCRSIKQLRRQGELTAGEDIEAAALQFVRKISGYRQPARKNEDAFERAVEEIALASRRMLAEMGAMESGAEPARVD
ncbi:MAG: DUF2277 domain-containing protein [Tepidiformaceae bacterium]